VTSTCINLNSLSVVEGDIEVSVGSLVSTAGGDFVTISGHDALESEEIFITILSESNQVVLDLNIFSTKDGEFSTIWMIENDLAPGTYTIKASDGDSEGKTTYTIFGENPPPEADVIVPAGTSVPGCEETNECFSPAEISIQVGDTVTWYNDDSAAHTVISGVTTDVNSVGAVFDSGLFFAGDTFSYKFTSSGNVPYFCIVHPWMTGKVIVGDDITPQDNTPPYIPPPVTTPTVPTPNVHIPTVTAPTTTPPVTTPPVTTPPVTTPSTGGFSEEACPDCEGSSLVTTPPITKSEPIPFTNPDKKNDKNSPLWSDKSIYEDGSIVHIEGKIKDVSSRSYISIEVYSPSNFSIVNEKVIVSNNGKFEIEFDTSNYLWYENGVYVIQIEDNTGKINQIEVEVVEEYPVTESSTLSLIPPIDATPDNDDLSQLIEENKKLREELKHQGEQIDDLNQEVNLLKEMFEGLKGFFDSLFG